MQDNRAASSVYDTVGDSIFSGIPSAITEWGCKIIIGNCLLNSNLFG